MIASFVLACCYTATLLACGLCRVKRPRPPAGGPKRIEVTGTFYNRGWFLSHALPLSKCGADEVIFVADEPAAEVERSRFVCPPRWLVRLAGRTLAKLACLIWAGIRFRPHAYMGYHIFPGAVSALLAARCLGRPAIYQMTGGPIEVAGGGWEAENVLMSRLGRPFPWLERLAMAVVRRFDLVVVRGNKARQFLLEHGVTSPVCVIPGSVEIPASTDRPNVQYDIVFVGRLSAIKQPEAFLDTLAKLRTSRPSARGAMAGDGPLMDSLKRRAADLGLAGAVDFLGRREHVADVLARSRVFVLPSRSEGLSIAMLEAMAHGLPAVVADVGELGDVVINGETGWLIASGRPEEYAQRITELLADEELYGRVSANARRAAVTLASTESVARCWRQALDMLCGWDRSPINASHAPSSPDTIQLEIR